MTTPNQPDLFLSTTEMWAHVQETKPPHFLPCPNCGGNAGQWVRVVRVDRATVAREKRCKNCETLYLGAKVTSDYGDYDTWEAEWLLSWRPFYKNWLKRQAPALRRNP